MSTNRYQLLVLSDERRGERIPLDTNDEFSIGRSGEVQIQFDNPSVSRHHAMFRRHGDRLMIEDVGSSGGTRVNSSRIEPNRAVQIENGDEVIFGSFHTQVLLIDEYDDQFDDGEMTMFGGAVELPDDLDEILALCDDTPNSLNKKKGHISSPISPLVDSFAESSQKDDPTIVAAASPASQRSGGNPYKGLTVGLLVVCAVLALVTFMAVFKWPVDLAALMN